MGTSGDAAEQVVRMSLEGMEAVAKISGKGAMEIAKLLLVEAKKPHKTKGKASLMKMLNQKKPIKVFEIDDKALKTFCQEAKKYGVMYHVIKDKTKNDGKCDIMVRAEDASKINRIFERFDLGIDTKAEVRATAAKAIKKDKQQPERTTPTRSAEDRFIEELFKKPQKEKTENDNPSVARTEKSRPSEPTSKTSRDRSRSRDTPERRPSVRKQLDEYKQQKKEQAKTKPPTQTQTKSKNKSKGSRSNGRS